MVEPHVPVEYRMAHERDIPDGEEAGRRRTLHLQPGTLGKTCARHGADADDHRIRRDGTAVIEPDRRDAAGGPFDGYGPAALPKVHAVAPMEVREERTHLGAERALEEGRPARQERHGGTALAGAGRHLRADPAAPDDDDGSATTDRGPDALGVPDGPQEVDLLEVGAREVGVARLGAGGEQQSVVAQLLTAGERHRRGPDIEIRRLDPQPQLDIDVRPARILGVISMASRVCSPRRNSLDRGGRSYGASGSAPRSTRRPSKPSLRSAIAAWAPAIPAPKKQGRSVRSCADGTPIGHDAARGVPREARAGALHDAVHHRSRQAAGEGVRGRAVAAHEVPRSPRALRRRVRTRVEVRPDARGRPAPAAPRPTPRHRGTR